MGIKPFVGPGEYSEEAVAEERKASSPGFTYHKRKQSKSHHQINLLGKKKTDAMQKFKKII